MFKSVRAEFCQSNTTTKRLSNINTRYLRSLDMRAAELIDSIGILDETIKEGDFFSIELEHILLETYVLAVTEDGVVIHGDDTLLAYLNTQPVNEAEYQGRKVPLGKPMKGDVAKSKVYVKGPKGNVVKVNFGDKKLSIKKHIPGRRKSFRARHNCDNPGPRWKARYWSCRAW